MRIEILEEARRDLVEGFHFYENQQQGLGAYFLSNLYADIEYLKTYAGIHHKPFKPYHRQLSKKFPFGIFYTVENETVSIHAVLDLRRSPTWIRKRLR